MVDETLRALGMRGWEKVPECIVACATMQTSASGLSSYQRMGIRGKAS